MSQKKLAFIFGAPGTGKDTIGTLISDACGGEHTVMSTLLGGGKPDGSFHTDDEVIACFSQHLGGCITFAEQTVGRNRKRQTEKLCPALEQVVYNGLPRTGEQVQGVIAFLREHDLLDCAAFLDLNGLNEHDAVARMMMRFNGHFAKGTLRPDEPANYEEARRRAHHRYTIHRVNVPGIEAAFANEGVQPVQINSNRPIRSVARDCAAALGWSAEVVSAYCDHLEEQVKKDRWGPNDQVPATTLPQLPVSQPRTAIAF